MSKTTKITEFEVCDLGIKHSAYFQGFGSGRYENAVVGIGTSEREALDDALESLAQQGDYDMEDFEERIRAEYGEASDDEILWGEYGVQFDDNGDPIDENGNPTEYPDIYHHIGIRWYEPDEESSHMGHKITIEIDTSNAAFPPDEIAEIARILYDAGRNLNRAGLRDLTLRDLNGNSVGKLTVTDN